MRVIRFAGLCDRVVERVEESRRVRTSGGESKRSQYWAQ